MNKTIHSQNILITGATGFIGSFLCEKLDKEGNKIYSIVRNLDKFKELNLPGTVIKGKLGPFGDESWADQLPSTIDCVIHLAGAVHSFNNEDFFLHNTKVTENFIRTLRARYQKIKFIFISSQSSLGPSNNLSSIKMNEHSAPNPVSKYGLSKFYAEQTLVALAPSTWDVFIFRPPMVIGPRDYAFLDLFKMVKSNLSLFIGKNSKNKQFSFISVFDLVKAIVHTIHLPHVKSRKAYYHVANPTPVRYIDIIHSIEKSMQKKSLHLKVPLLAISFIAGLLKLVNRVTPINIALTPDKINEIAATSWVLNSDKMIRDFNFVYDYDLNKTIQSAYTDYKQRSWL